VAAVLGFGSLTPGYLMPPADGLRSRYGKDRGSVPWPGSGAQAASGKKTPTYRPRAAIRPRNKPFPLRMT
jgi:hypothetical protein